MRRSPSLAVTVASAFVVIACMIAFLFVVVNLAPSTESVKRNVESAGYTDVVIASPDMLSARFFCAEDDYFYYDVVRAVNAQGENVTNMYVCAGLLKGQTIRYR